MDVLLFFVVERESNRINCNSPVDCCSRGLDRGTPLFSTRGRKCKSTPVSCSKNLPDSYGFGRPSFVNGVVFRKVYETKLNQKEDYPDVVRYVNAPNYQHRIADLGNCPPFGQSQVIKKSLCTVCRTTVFAGSSEAVAPNANPCKVVFTVKDAVLILEKV